MEFVLNSFEAGESITLGIRRSGYWKSRLFWAHFKVKKSLDFQGPPLPMPRVMDLASLKTAVARVSLVAAFPPTIDVTSASGVSNVSVGVADLDRVPF
jgi:hypothetical protein